MYTNKNTIIINKDIKIKAVHFIYWGMLVTVLSILFLLPATSFAKRNVNRNGNANNVPPFAIIKKVTQTGVVPYSVSFDGTRSRDRDGRISSYKWDFGDGSTDTGGMATHVFNEVGDYTVTLLVTDGKGATDTVTTQISVSPAPDPTPIGERPIGIYSKGNLVDLPFVSGVVAKLFWSDLEPQEGVYDFSRIEEVVREAVQVGQSVTLTTMLLDEPSWLMQKIPNEDKYQGIQSTDIVPWNETMLVALEKLVQAQSRFKIDGIQLKDHPTIKQVTASIGTMNSIRMKTITREYTPELLKQGVKRSIRAWANAYSDKHLHVGLFGVSDGLLTAFELRDELLNEFDGINKPRINYFIEYWTGQQPFVTNDILFEIKDETSILMQSCGAWSEQNTRWVKCGWVEPSDSPERGFNHAMDNFNTTYFEVYGIDLENPQYYDQFEEAAVKIQQLADDLD